MPESAIGDAEPTTKGFNVYKTEIVNFIDAEGIEPGQSIESYTNFIMGEVVNRLDSNKAENLVRAIWYCIDGSDARVQSGDMKIIEHFNDKVLVVITKGETMRKKQTEEMLKSLSAIVEYNQFVIVSSHMKQGLKQLLDKVEPIVEQSLAQVATELAEFRSRWKSYYHIGFMFSTITAPFTIPIMDYNSTSTLLQGRSCWETLQIRAKSRKLQISDNN